MNPAEYNATLARLKAGEPVELTPEQAAGFIQAQTSAQIAAGLDAAGREPQPIEADALDGILCRYGGNFGIWALFTRIVKAYRITPAAFASGLAAAYTMGRADRKTALTFFEFADRAQTMEPGERAALDGMPERLRIYRGCGTSEHRRGVYGLSWTRSRAVAEFFAWRFDAADKGRAVVSCEIPRADVLAYFDRRGESEIIADVRRGLYAVEVIAREPSGLYWDYMNRDRRGASISENITLQK